MTRKLILIVVLAMGGLLYADSSSTEGAIGFISKHWELTKLHSDAILSLRREVNALKLENAEIRRQLNGPEQPTE